MILGAGRGAHREGTTVARISLRMMISVLKIIMLLQRCEALISGVSSLTHGDRRDIEFGHLRYLVAGLPLATLPRVQG